LTDEFDRDLEAVFEERAGDFSSELKALLEDLYQQGVLAGRARERKDQLEMMSGKLSECGNYWCTPLNKTMLVLSGARAGAERLEEKARQRPGARDPNYASAFDEFVANIDAQILEKLASQARAQEHQLPGNLVVLVRQPAPRVPTRQPANQHEWVMGVDLAIGSDSTAWTKQLLGNYANSRPTSMAAALQRSVTVTPIGGKSGKS